MRRRWPILLAASLTLAGCARSTTEAPVTRGQGREPDLRVGIVVGASGVRVGAQGPAVATQGGAPVFRLSTGESIRLVPDGRALRNEGADNARYETLTFISTDRGRLVTVDDRPYRGAIEVIVRDGAVTVVNVVPLETYLRGVVNAEMGRRTGEERAALEAQAVVSRTYALRNRGRFASAGYDVRASVTDQVYLGGERETADGDAAVRATRGLVLAHAGRLVTPFFHSTCGGSTASPETVFRTVRSEPYLRPVSDARPGAGHYCDISPRFSWRVEWEGTNLRDILRRTLPSVVGVDTDAVSTLRDVYVRSTGASGRARDLRVRVDDGEIPVAGHDIRAVLETPDGRALGSSYIAVDARRDEGRVTRLVIDGLGWGHGVGMCQWGAVGRARAGQSARRILETYFPGASLARWY